MTANPAPRWQRRPDARPDEILSAAIAVFGEVGFSKAKLEDVAKRAGVSKGTLYLYFDSKDALFREMVRTRVVRRTVMGEALLDQNQGSARGLLEQFIRAWWDAAREPEMATIIRLVHSEIGNFPELAQFFADEVKARTRRLLKAILDLGLARGEFRPFANDFPYWAVGLLVVQGAMQQRFWSRYEPEPMSDEQIIRGIVELIVRAVEAPDSPGPRPSEGG